MCRGGHGAWAGLGSNITGPKSKNSPWCSTTASLQSLRHTSRARPPAPPGSRSQSHRLPLGLEPAGPDAEFQPSPGHHVQGGHGPGHDEGMAQADVVDLGAEVDLLGLPGQEAQIGEGVEDRDIGRYGRVVRAGERAPGQLDRDDQMLGSQTDSNPSRSATPSPRPTGRPEHSEGDSDLHRTSSWCGSAVTASPPRPSTIPGGSSAPPNDPTPSPHSLTVASDNGRSGR